MNIIINPGSGPVDGATVECAEKNMAQLAEDVRAAHGYQRVVVSRRDDLDEGGRYGFAMTATPDGPAATVFEVEMPGLPLEQVRYLGLPEQNIWHFPRLYVDGGSWVWRSAVNICAPDSEDDAS